jgi:hypothetical protein
MAGKGDIGNSLYANAAPSYPATRQEVDAIGGSLMNGVLEVRPDNPTEFEVMWFRVFTATQDALVVWTGEIWVGRTQVSETTTLARICR